MLKFGKIDLVAQHHPIAKTDKCQQALQVAAAAVIDTAVTPC